MKIKYEESELQVVAKELLLQFGDAKTWLFDGEMGAGKTTLIKAVCAELGVKDTMGSPTFSIINEYKTRRETICHFDFYRIEDSAELINIGVEEYFFSGNRCFIEWPEAVNDFLPDNYLKISIKLAKCNTRYLTAKCNGPIFSKWTR